MGLIQQFTHCVQDLQTYLVIKFILWKANKSKSSLECTSDKGTQERNISVRKHYVSTYALDYLNINNLVNCTTDIHNIKYALW